LKKKSPQAFHPGSRPAVVVSLVETSVDGAIERALAAPAADGFELRADQLGRLSRGDFERFRSAVGAPLIFTRRSSAGAVDTGEVLHAIEAGFDLVDVEFVGGFDYEPLRPHAGRILLSHHDYERVPPLEELIGAMKAAGFPRLKIAVTPHSVEENLAVLRAQAAASEGTTLIAMGERGLYARILAPFFGGEIAFAAAGASSLAAPGQLTLERALDVYGEAPRQLEVPDAIFAVVGRPASHSLSPSIHNTIFREMGVRAAYSILEVERFVGAATLFASGERFAPRGLSVTAPFKEEAFAFASDAGAMITERALEARAVNTLVRQGGGSITADNTDIEAFGAALRSFGLAAGKAAVVGAGGTARSAVVGLRSGGVDPVLFNRGRVRREMLARELRVEARRLDRLDDFDCDLLVNTVGADFDVPEGLLDRVRFVIDVRYAEASPLAAAAKERGLRVFDGLEFLRAQAKVQSELFTAAAAAGSRRGEE
jgi:3-dehydroquinate dehydratase / shikimate dehydrogenase